MPVQPSIKSSGVIDLPKIEDRLDFVRAKNTGGRITRFDTLQELEDKKRRFVALTSEMFGLTEAEAEREYEDRIAARFAAAATPRAPTETTVPIQILTIPYGPIQRYQGKKRSGEVYAFLRRIYPPNDSVEAKPLTLDYLRENDNAALVAFRSRRRSVPVPTDLLVLTDPTYGFKHDETLNEFGVTFDTPVMEQKARRLMNALSAHFYPR